VPCWGYGLRYDYGVFRQELTDKGEQVEVPDYWLEKGNPWEIERPDVTYKIRFYGKVSYQAGQGFGTPGKAAWEGGEMCIAAAYDMPITGYNTFNTNNLRLWRSRPYDEYDPSIHKEDELGLPNEEEEFRAQQERGGCKSRYIASVEQCQDAE
jgi:starch phosphorylase